MNTIKTIILITFLSVFYAGFSQRKFKKAYFIDNDNKRTECLIKQEEWGSNPTQFKYKLTESSNVLTGTIKFIKEFEISNQVKYKRVSVEIDRSSKHRDKLSYDKEPNFIKETLFLKSLIEGEASLYSYRSNNLFRFFYSTKNVDLQQLIIKTYKASNPETGLVDIKTNKAFQKQLWDNLKSENINVTDIRKTSYRTGDLVKIFKKYNLSKNSNYTNFNKNSSKNILNLNIRPGANFSSIKFEKENEFYPEANFGSKVNFRMGIELEWILPFYNNKWSLFLEPTYVSSFTEEKEIVYITAPLTSINSTAKIEYQKIEIPIGIRHYFSLNENSKLFITGSIVFNNSFESSTGFKDRDFPSFDFNPKNNNIAIGVGYKHKKFGVELRYSSKNNIAPRVRPIWSSIPYNSFGITFGYQIFTTNKK